MAVLQRRKLTSAILACSLSVVLLLCAFIWYYLRFRTQQGQLTDGELWEVLGYALAIGWLFPLLATALYWLRVFRPVAQDHTPRKELARLFAAKQGKPPVPATVQPPHYEPGVLSPYVFGDDIPWGWLEYSNGNFQGQRLALKRAVITIGRDENCDIWLDDDMASRHHAELAWCQQQVCLTDCQSLNGVLINGHQVQGTVQVSSQDELQIGAQRFLFILAEQKVVQDEQYDPLVNHTWRSTHDLQMDTSSLVLAAADSHHAEQHQEQEQETPSHKHVVETNHALLSSQETEDESDEAPTLIVRSGSQAGLSLWLLAPVITIGSSDECLLVLHDDSVASVHVQIYHQPYGDYLQALTNESEVSVNNMPIQGVQLLRAGDLLRLGTVLCEYLVPQATDSGMVPSPHSSTSLSGPVPLRLPSRMKPD